MFAPAKSNDAFSSSPRGCSETWELRKGYRVMASLRSAKGRPSESRGWLQLSLNVTRVQMLAYLLHSHLNTGHDREISVSLLGEGLIHEI